MTASRQVTVQNELGLHARPAMQFVDLANQFQCQIKVSKLDDDEKIEADGKSVMQMLTLAAVKDTVLRLDADGPDATEAIEKLARLFDEKFGEE
jgi:phosphocarrier protein